MFRQCQFVREKLEDRVQALLSVNDFNLLLRQFQKIKLRELPATQYTVDKGLFSFSRPNFASLPIGNFISITPPVDFVDGACFCSHVHIGSFVAFFASPRRSPLPSLMLKRGLARM